jgi:L-histidine N-alpha-methyltransferase
MLSAATERGESRAALYEATVYRLRAEPKELPAVWLYDERGSLLYEEITRLPDYYLPRREGEILRARAPAIAGRMPATTLVELGAGNAKNTRLLLDALDSAGTLERFIPLDVSEQTLRASAEAIEAAYPRISVEAIVGDFERDLDLLPGGGRRLIAFLGSTIGNLYPDQRARLLTALADSLTPSDALLLGVDLVKDVARVEAAYNDPDGVTEAFVRNALTAVNRELDATFDQRRFVYAARWDPDHEWMDIGFRARQAHEVSIGRLGIELTFDVDEPLRVEISSKFRREPFELEAARAGLRVESWWTDAAGDFAVALVFPDPFAGS